ncbi:cAMP responsive element binding protein 5 [Phyllostomus discolor]|uniref:cAMP responsive element binding protein 5 n=1 Tax=Phyllostomus discolor TaxID=89673 RepID=A0A833Z3J7_9CHIR|nr:cAMP responsive element binding protein 5 [Phyllostomus discolor]
MFPVLGFSPCPQGKIDLTLFPQVIPISCQNITEGSSEDAFFFPPRAHVMSPVSSFLENRFEMLTKAIRSAGHCISTTAWASSLARHAPSPPCHPPSRCPQVSPATQQMQPTQTIQPPQPTGGRRRRVVDEDPDERRRKFLERNRAAATRCRQKRKVWVMSLEKKAEELTQTNMQLQNEVSMLKNEVAQLKQLLLTHKDCPITAMQKESQGYLSPESSPPASPAPACSQQQVIQHNTITTSSAVSEVVGSSTLSQLTTHRTDLNPIL